MVKIRQYDPTRVYKPLTDNQRVALARNWRIFQLRGYYRQAKLINNLKRRRIIEEMIDEELLDLGAELEFTREERRQALYLTSYITPPEKDEEIQF